MKIRKEPVIVLTALTILFMFSYFEWYPVEQLMDWKAKRNASTQQTISLEDYELYDHSGREDPFLTIDFLKGQHFWHPQVAIWLEDSAGNYLETLLVTTSTARGLFYAGRSADNFKTFDGAKTAENSTTRRVDALPHWSHARGVRYEDGFYSPSPEHPLPDGISGATPKGNFYFKSNYEPASSLSAFTVKVEVNVAFDENEYFSEYDFVEDTLYHGGTGLMGQPSVIYGATIRKTNRNRYYVMEMLGHGHHSGGNGTVYTDMTPITTAQYIVERIVVGVSKEWLP